MKYHFFVALFFVLPYIIYAQNEAVITGKILNPKDSTCRIETFTKGSFMPIQVPLVNQSFTKSLPVSDIEFFRVRFSSNQYVVIIAQSGEQIQFSVDPANILGTFQVTGSDYTQQVYKLEKQLLDIQNNAEKKKSELEKNKATFTDVDKKSHRIAIDSLYQVYQSVLTGFISKNLDNPATLFFIEKLKIEDYPELYKQFSASIGKKYPNNDLVNYFCKKTDALLANSVGTVASDIRLPGIDGDTIGLYPIQASLLVIDFWASWCGPCRKSNPTKSAIYQKYKDKGFQVYSVSLDQNMTSWKNAIVQDKLDWKNHVSELKGWQSSVAKQYGVSSIPANFIVDSNGKIIAKNVRGEDLVRFVDTYYTKQTGK